MNEIIIVVLCIILFPYIVICLGLYSTIFHFIIQLPICFYIGKKRYGYRFSEIINRMRFAEIKFSDGLGSEPIPYKSCLSCNHYSDCVHHYCNHLSCGERSDALWLRLIKNVRHFNVASVIVKAGNIVKKRGLNVPAVVPFVE